MFDALRKGMLLGIGVATLTEKEIRQSVQALVKRGYIKGEEARKMANQLLREAKMHKTRLQKLAEEEAKKHFSKLDKASRAELVAMKKRLVALEGKVRQKAIGGARYAAKKFLQKTAPRKKKS